MTKPEIFLAIARVQFFYSIAVIGVMAFGDGSSATVKWICAALIIVKIAVSFIPGDGCWVDEMIDFASMIVDAGIIFALAFMSETRDEKTISIALAISSIIVNRRYVTEKLS